MSEYVLLGITVYLWLVGGIFITIGAVNADFKGVRRTRIAAMLLLWPLITLYAAVFVTGQDLVRRVRMWRAR